MGLPPPDIKTYYSTSVRQLCCEREGKISEIEYRVHMWIMVAYNIPEKNRFFSIKDDGHLANHMEISGFIPQPYTSITSKWIIKVHVKHKRARRCDEEFFYKFILKKAF